MFIDTQMRPQGEVQQVGKLKLSEAIRIGARLRPQCTGLLYDGYRSCALGAAMEANGFDLARMMVMRDQKEFNDAVSRVHPDLRTSSLWSEIGSRNDSGETREQIADWLESQGY